MRELSLFTGAGGGLLGSRLLGWRTVCAVEIDPYCQEVLIRRQADGWLDPFPIWPDVRTFDGHAWRGRVDVVTAGFPCQPFSVAGKRKGERDERNGWPDTARILGEVRPRHALLENVSGLLDSGYFGRVLSDLADLGLDATWGVFSAGAAGAHHLRARLWIHAHTDEVRPQRIGSATSGAWSEQQLARLVQDQVAVSLPAGRSGGISDGAPNRLDRLSATGNAQVPIVVARAWRSLQ